MTVKTKITPEVLQALKDLVAKITNVQSTYIGNNFEDTQTQNMLQDLVRQTNLLAEIVKKLVDNL